MTPLEKIKEWKRGCSCAAPGRPEECTACTKALIDSLEKDLIALMEVVKEQNAKTSQ